EYGGKMPCVCHNGEAHVETAEILAWIDREFPTASSLQPPVELAEQVKGFGVFPAIAQFTKNTDSAKDEELRVKLETSLRALSKRLESAGAYLQGAEPGLLDCDILPKLYVLSLATAHYKNFKLEDLKDGEA
ncbi:Chloride intracellular channel protein 1, partial [Durusdinium trenchii]